MKKEYLIVIFLALFFMAFFWGYYEETKRKFADLANQAENLDRKNSDLNRSLSDYIRLYGKLKICPDRWIIDQMPCVGEGCNGSREFFQVNGEDRETSEFDLDWISKNCKINKPGILH